MEDVPSPYNSSGPAFTHSGDENNQPEYHNSDGSYAGSPVQNVPRTSESPEQAKQRHAAKMQKRAATEKVKTPHIPPELFIGHCSYCLLLDTQYIVILITVVVWWARLFCQCTPYYLGLTCPGWCVTDQVVLINRVPRKLPSLAQPI